MAFTLRHAMSSLLLLWLCACSTSPYKDQVTAFDKALTKAQTGFVGLANQQATVAAVRQVNEAAVRDGRVLTVSSCNLTLSSRKEPGNCTLMLSGREPVATKSPAANGLVLMKAFVTYGDALAKLVAAKDISDLNSGISKVNSSIGGLVKTLGGTASFIPYVGPALELAALGFDLSGGPPGRGAANGNCQRARRSPTCGAHFGQRSEVAASGCISNSKYAAAETR